jgi:hypothetical protein
LWQVFEQIAVNNNQRYIFYYRLLFYLWEVKLTCLTQYAGVSWIAFTFERLVAVAVLAARKDLTVLAALSGPAEAASALPGTVTVTSGGVTVQFADC